GVDAFGTRRFEPDPSSALESNKTGSIGQRCQAVMELLEEKYKEGMTQDYSSVLGLEALQKASEGEKLDARAIEVGLIVEGEKFRRLPESEVGQYLTRVPTAS